MNEEDIFHEALARTQPEERAAYLDQACAGDSTLRASVEALLRASLGASAFLAPSAAAQVATLDEPSVAERPGTVIGPYKLIQQIGEGGMGTVYMAQQTEPVKRAVALKIIKAGMDTRQVIARFEAERQALALMDHPNIAKVLDAGTTGTEPDASARVGASSLAYASGCARPYFVMELVKGVSITKYCDEHRLTPRQRLELFIPVCQAVQHAHQKGIIHRDLKPSNILVAQYDGRPVPKVIDFGVAKAAGQQLTDKTLMTGFGTLIGTLEYMSPEQAEINQLDIDTRSDIYSLGVVLYELLTGSTPLDRNRLKQAAFTEMLRIIREEEPPKPSTRLSDSTDSLPSVSAQRHMEPAKLTRSMRGELDWIVMKALEKDRNRRYETANGFAADVQRYLDDEQVLACPPSAWYRFRKFARRNKRAMATAALLAMTLVVGVGVVAGSIGWAARDRAARQARLAGQVELILDEVDRLEQEQKWPEALAVTRQAEVVLAGGEADPVMSERVREALAELEMIGQLEEIRLSRSEPSGKERTFDFARTARRYATAFREYGLDVETLPPDEAAARLRSRMALVVPVATALDEWGDCSRGMSNERLAKELWALAGTIDPDPWRLRLRQAIVAQDVTGVVAVAESPNTARQPPQSQVLLARGLQGCDRVTQAIVLLERAGEAHPADFWIHLELGSLNGAVRPKRLEAQVRHYIAARALRPRSVGTWNNLGVALRAQGKLDEAIACYRQAITLDPKSAFAHYNLGIALHDQRKLGEAIACFKKAIELNHPNLAIAHYNLGIALYSQKKLDEAVACYRKAIALDPKSPAAHNNLGNALASQNDLPGAIAELREAIRLQPDDAATHVNLGTVLAAQNDLPEAVAALKEAIKLDPKNASAHNNLGAALATQNDLPGAIAAYKRAIELDPKQASANNNLGLALVTQNDLPGAIAAFKEAIALDAKYAPAYWSLAELLANCPDLKLRQPPEALALAKKAVELAPRSGNAWQSLGIAQYRVGDWKASIEALEKSIEVNKKGADSLQWFFLAMAQHKLGHEKEARQWYDRAVEWMEKNQPRNEVLRRLRAEAAALLKVKVNEP